MIIAAVSDCLDATCAPVEDHAMTLADLDDRLNHVPRDHELLVGSADPQKGPYSHAVTVPKNEVDAKCRAGFRRLSAYEHDAMQGAIEDYTADWKHSE